MATAEEDEAARERDDVRCEAALSTLEDVLWRFNETNEGTLAVYDVLGFLVEDRGAELVLELIDDPEKVGLRGASDG